MLVTMPSDQKILPDPLDDRQAYVTIGKTSHPKIYDWLIQNIQQKQISEFELYAQ